MLNGFMKMELNRIVSAIELQVKRWIELNKMFSLKERELNLNVESHLDLVLWK